MKHAQAAAIILWMLGVPAMLTRWWMQHPDSMPPLSPKAWRWFESLWGEYCCQSVWMMDLLYGLTLSFVANLALTLTIFGLSRRVRHRRPPSS